MSYFSLPPEYVHHLHEERTRRLDQATRLRHDRRAAQNGSPARRLRRHGA